MNISPANAFQAPIRFGNKDKKPKDHPLQLDGEPGKGKALLAKALADKLPTLSQKPRTGKTRLTKALGGSSEVMINNPPMLETRIGTLAKQLMVDSFDINYPAPNRNATSWQEA